MAPTDFALPLLDPSGMDGFAFDAPATVGASGAAMSAALSAAHTEAETIRATAHAEGLAQGLAEGRESVAAAGMALQQALAEIAAERAHSADVVERAAVALALTVAEQALGTALEVEPERVVDVVRGALRRLVERDRVTVLVHPDDLDIVRDAVPSLVAGLGGMEHCEVQAERRLVRGGAIVRTAEGEVDATLPTKLARAAEVIAEALRGTQPPHGDG